MTMARRVGYDNVGTWEWIVSRSGRPFLMEVNSRIQVENGVSGLISRVRGKGPVDIVSEQIRIGLGEDMGYTQNDVTFEGVGIEYRLLAEDPANKFAPWVGLIEEFDWPEEPWLKVHSQVSRGVPYDIPTEFDPNLALALVWGKDLAEAKARGREFLDRFILRGRNKEGKLKSNVDFLRTKTEHLLEF